MKLKLSLVWRALALAGLSAAGAVAGEPGVVNQDRVNVRGQASLVGEVVTQLDRGERVIILEEVASKRTGPGEPTNWFKIQMPANTPVWVSSSFIDPAGKFVTARRLNLRAGPGENHNVVGRLERGESVKEIRVVQDWMEIQAPTNAYAFVAAALVTKASAPVIPPLARTEVLEQPKPSAPPPSSVVVAPPPPGPVSPPAAPAVPAPSSINPGSSAITETRISAPIEEKPKPSTSSLAASERPAESVPVPPSASIPEIPVATPKPPPAAPAVPPAVAAPLVSETSSALPRRRIVRREGVVRSTVSIQAPTYFELLNPQTRSTINYIHAGGSGFKLKDYRGDRIIITGEEMIDPRWPKVPVIEIETLDLAP